VAFYSWNIATRSSWKMKDRDICLIALLAPNATIWLFRDIRATRNLASAPSTIVAQLRPAATAVHTTFGAVPQAASTILCCYTVPWPPRLTA